MINVIAMPRTGHTAIMNWMRGLTKTELVNTEGKWFGESISKDGYPVLILRDYRNWLASSIVRVTVKQGYEHEFINEPKKLIDKWMSHAEAAFTIHTLLYPRWVAAGHGKGVKGKQSRFPFGDTDYMTRYEYVEGYGPWSDLYRRFTEDRPDAVRLSDSIDWLPAEHISQQARCAV